MLTYVLLGLFACSVGYLSVAIIRVTLFRVRTKQVAHADGARPVSVLKPISGVEVELIENLRSFCDQDYGEYQVLFGVHSSADPAIPMIKQIIAEFPDLDVELVVDERIIGSNYKISNIANIAARAKHDIFVISDSDMRVDQNYLKSVVEPFSRSDVGATTCLYSGHARGGVSSKMAAMFVNDWFLPSALIPVGFAEQEYCFGATMTVRRDVLEKAGGFNALADFLADDYMLGKIVSDAGFKIALVPYLVANVMQEASLRSLFLHELRWARTIRSVRPLGYALSAITEILPWSIIASVALFVSGFGMGIVAGPVALALALRLALHRSVAGGLVPNATAAPLLIPLRDCLSFAIRIAGYFGNRVHWRTNTFTVMDDNRITVTEDAEPTEQLSPQTIS